MSAVEDRLAAMLAKHRTRVVPLTMTYSSAPHAYKATCSCGWQTRPREAESGGHTLAVEAIDRHVAAVVASSDDLAVIELRPPTGVESDGVHWDTDVFVIDGDVFLDGEPVATPFAVALAADLLAAAKAAEGVDRG